VPGYGSMSPIAAAMTEAEPETRRVLLKAHALYDKGVGIARIASQLPVGAFVQPATFLSFPLSG
jgi:hypothetical protein